MSGSEQSAARLPRIPGIHHVTAISGPAQENVDFYAGVLGLRTVKQTVNFDDPGTHHLYFGDRSGTPGTIMTFFPWAHAAPGARGSGYTGSTAFSVPPGSLEFWAARLERAGASPGEVETRFGSDVLPCQDPDGLVLELVAGPDTKETEAGPPVHPEIASEHAIRSFHGVLLDVADPDASARLLTDLMGYEHMGEEGAGLDSEVEGMWVPWWSSWRSVRRGLGGWVGGVSTTWRSVRGMTPHSWPGEKLSHRR